MAKAETHSRNKGRDPASCIVIEPGRGAVIEGCRRIIECTEILTRVRTAGYIVEIFGQALRTDTYNIDTVEVRGAVTSVELIPCGKRGEGL